MIKVAAKLTVIAALAAAGTHFGYRELEKQLQSSSCLPEPPKSVKAAGKSAAAAMMPDELAPSGQDFQIIVRRDLFKTAADKTAKTPEPPPQPPVAPTALKLTLAGTVTGTEQTARAIIVNNAGGDRKQQLLQIGDGVPGTAAVIKSIQWSSIELDVNGKIETLEMPKPKNAPGSGRLASMNPPPRPPEQDMNPPAAEADNNGPAARPNRRISLPPDQPAETLPPPDQPAEVLPELEPPVDAEAMPANELPALELPEEQAAPELPPIDVK